MIITTMNDIPGYEACVASSVTSYIALFVISDDQRSAQVGSRGRNFGQEFSSELKTFSPHLL
jgi:hypothetical protein